MALHENISATDKLEHLSHDGGQPTAHSPASERSGQEYGPSRWRMQLRTHAVSDALEVTHNSLHRQVKNLFHDVPNPSKNFCVSFHTVVHCL